MYVTQWDKVVSSLVPAATPDLSLPLRTVPLKRILSLYHLLRSVFNQYSDFHHVKIRKHPL